MNEDKHIIIGFDAKRVVRNGTGLGAYGRNLVNDLSHCCSMHPMRVEKHWPNR